MTVEMGLEFRDMINSIKTEPEIKVLIITGKGTSFSSGGDFNSTFELFNAPFTEARKNIYDFYKTFLSVRELEIPIIAALNGYVIGTGLSLALACDIRIAATDTKMSMSFVKLGIHPGMGGSYFLPSLVGKAKAFEIFLTGDIINSLEAQKIGLVNHVVSPEELMDFSLNMADRIAQNPILPIRLIKKSVYREDNKDLDSALEFESYAQAACSMTDEMKERVSVFKGGRKSTF